MHATNFVTYPTLRLIAGFYAQVTSAEKQVQAVYDLSLVLSPDVQAQLYGDVTAEEVFAFHWGIRQEFYPDHEEAKAWATQVLDRLEPRMGCLKLNRKIDSKGQRRLQCSATLGYLLALAGNPQPFTETFHGLALPFSIQRTRRELKNKSGQAASLE